MIIDCINCSKKFEVNSSLIPENGRTIQCGSCNHVWFYKPQIDTQNDETISDVSETQNKSEIEISLVKKEFDENYKNQTEKEKINTNKKLISDKLKDKNTTKKSSGISKFF